MGRRRTAGVAAAGITGVAAVAAATVVTSVGLSVAPGGTPPARAEGLSAFGDCAELERFAAPAVQELRAVERSARRAARSSVNSRAAGSAAVGPQAAAAAAPGQAGPGVAGGPGAAELATAVGPGGTGTNVQEAGIDEPDLAKTDGRLLYTVASGRLNIVDPGSGAAAGSANGPGSPRVLGSLALPGTPTELLLLPGSPYRALVVGQTRADLSTQEGLLDGPGSLQPTRTVVTLVDLADPAAPRVLASDTLDGAYLSARLRDGVVRLVVSTAPAVWWSAADRPGRNEALRIQDWLPRRERRDGAGRLVAAAPLLGCADIRHPASPAGLGLLSVLTYDTAAADPLAGPRPTGVLAGGEVVYAADERLYVATSDAWSRPCALDFCVAGSRSMPPGTAVTTSIHAFDATRRDATPYLRSGSVPGVLLNRWAMSEHEGRLRVATTQTLDATQRTTATPASPAVEPTGPPRPPIPGTDVPSTESAVVVLAERGGALVEVGRAGGLGRGERVRGVRWFGDLAAVVTFRQTDPLYLVDVADPTRPRTVGELKVPGYSAYLHPLGGDLLLGVGQDADPATGATRGAQAAVFDVSDRTRPRRVAVLDLGSGTALAEHDSRAFGYLPDRRLVLLPMQSVSGQDDGAVAVSVGPDGGLQDAGRVAGRPGEQVARVLPVGERLAAVTAGSVSVVEADGLRPTGTARLS